MAWTVPVQRWRLHGIRTSFDSSWCFHDVSFAFDNHHSFNPMESTEELKNALAETRKTLKDAIAREENYRIREQHLLEENLKLRDELKRANHAGGAHSTSAANPDAAESSQQGRNSSTLLEEYPIVIHTKKGIVRAVRETLTTLSRSTGHLLPDLDTWRSSSQRRRSLRTIV